VARDILVPVDHVVAIYARENGQGMAFPMLASSTSAAAEESLAENKGAVLTRVTSASVDDGPEVPRPSGGGKPSLTRIK
jgi:stringent starvation protein B